ncbi:MAG TPA: fumarate reductase subunit FrdD [Xanthomonadales bacterium]|nr:fumarate reductase subunit FrdD [Xanthomonadales bacterium]
MAIANKSLVWALFAAGGTLTAFLFPALIALFLLVATGNTPEGLAYGSARAFVASWSGKTVLFGILLLSLWHAAHRMRVLLHDFGLRADGIIAAVLYLLAAVGSILSAVILIGTH